MQHQAGGPDESGGFGATLLTTLDRTTPRPKKTAVILAGQIVNQILRENLSPGTRLPAEQEMLRTYGVGRGTLREALRYLELQGVLTIKQGPRGGPVVMSPDGSNLASVLSMLLALKRTPFRQVVAVRLLLEPPICGLAAQQASHDDLRHLHELTESMADPNLSDEDFLQLNQRFHEVIAAAAANDVLGFFVTSLHSISDGAVVGISYAGRRKAVVRAHEEIVRALEERDPDASEAAMRRHLEDWRSFVEARHRAALDRPITW